MPKPTKKVVKKVTKPEPVVEETPAPVDTYAPAKNDDRRPVYRVFECVIHLEQAIRHLEGVGITPSLLQETSESRKKIIAELKQQLADYKLYWSTLR